MSRPEHVVGRAAAALFVGIVGIVAIGPGTPTAASPAELPSLELDPTSGPPESQVVAVARGYGSCPPTGFDDVGPGTVAFLWDGESELMTVEVTSDGSATAEFAVPLDAELSGHVVVSRCAGPGGLEVREPFTVTPPKVVQVQVPSVMGMTRAEATGTITGADLAVGTVTGGGGVVEEQTPEPGANVDPQTVVDLVLGTVAPSVVEVPSVVGFSRSEAEAALVEAGLALGKVLGEPGGEVSEQSPPAGLEVTPGTVVDIVLVADPQESAYPSPPCVVARSRTCPHSSSPRA